MFFPNSIKIEFAIDKRSHHNSYEITDSVFLRAGAKLAFPFATNYKTTLTVGSTTTEDKSKMTGFMFNITPFIGASYQF